MRLCGRVGQFALAGPVVGILLQSGYCSPECVETGRERRTVQGEGVDILPVVSEDHKLLAKANGIFPSRDTIELL